MLPGVTWVPDLDETVPLGRCVGVRLPPPGAPWAPDALSLLHPDELARARTLSPRRQATYVGGRLALRHALRGWGVLTGPLTSNDRGAPVVPDGWTGSISHKTAVAVALAAPRDAGHVGVDVEAVVREGSDIAAHVLTPAEQAAVARLPGHEQRPAVLLHFSLKEAIYKALDPYVRRYVGFQEVEVTPVADGGVVTLLRLVHGEGPFRVTGWWRTWGDFHLSAARVSP
jgi:4'-phosphopantetheinyl transferase EntD